MKIEIILLGVIGLVFLVDFIMNSRKKPSIDNVVDQIEGGEPVKNQSGNTKLSKFILLFTVLVNVLITLWIILFEDAGFLKFMENADGQFIQINGKLRYNSFLYVINLFLVPLFFIKGIGFNYLLKRKKNFSLSIILILFSKLLAHFFIYTTVLNNSLNNLFEKVQKNTPYREYEAPLSYHIDNIFNSETWLFIPVTILLIFIAWFFNEKIKAR
tara:strand:- start:3174 stop:3815 length:642 start_codon:yes stop_codon:yes gene_type:complete